MEELTALSDKLQVARDAVQHTKTMAFEVVNEAGEAAIKRLRQPHMFVRHLPHQPCPLSVFP